MDARRTEGDHGHVRTDDCGCIRCREERYDLSRRSFIDTVIWSGGLFRKYPSAVALFGTVAVLGYLGYLTDATLAAVALFSRGYLGVCAADEVHDDTIRRGVWGRLVTVAKKMPVVAVAIAVPYAVLVAMVLAALAIGEHVLPDSLTLFVVFVAAIAIFVAASFVFVQVKFLLIPEACFIGGAGVSGALRQSWRAVRLRRVGTVAVAGSFSLLVAFLVFDGVSDGDVEGTRAAASVATTAFYSGLFAHLYLERDAENSV